jgi:hypothetical protein
LRRNVEAVEERIVAACRRAGRQRGDVRLVAVTKSAPDDAIPALVDLDIFDFGESRPQELWRKIALFAGTLKVRWHMVGHLQRNKVERTAPVVRLIHSVDSLRLLDAVEAAARVKRPTDPLPVFLEVNTSGEASKFGFTPDEVRGLAEVLPQLQAVKLCGLMTMAPLEAEPEKCRPHFALLRQLRDRLATDLAGRHPIHHLSMGMSNDFEVAIEEGATFVRIGSALFEGLPPGAEA